MAWTKSIVISVGAALVAYALARVTGTHSYELFDLPVPMVCVLLAFAMQWLAFVPAVLARTEHFYDLWGATTYLVCVATALAASWPASNRAILVTGLVTIWALRLGSFLFLRVRRQGGDARFDAIKVSAPRFLIAWSLQGLWVSMTLLAVLLAISSRDSVPLGIVDLLGASLWLTGFVIETIADRQKSQFRKAKPTQPYISSGLWAWSRHPNYFGEILLWSGLALVASASMSGWEWLGLLSPLFVLCLLRFGSGIPILERRADAKFGHLPSYQDYKAKTSLLLLLPPR